MKIAVSGASGLVGRHLLPALQSHGHEVVALVRDRTQAGIHWDPTSGVADPSSLEGVDALVHLAGANIGAKRWSAARKQLLVSSRVDATEALCKNLAALSDGPRVVVGASAIGIYGDRQDQELPESASAGTGFLPDLCERWEAAYSPARDAGIRVVNLRTGIVLSGQGGALAKMLPPFRLGLGGPIGSGRQWMSWISMTDMVAMYRWALESPVSGPVNAVSPNPVTNRDFGRELGRALNRPAVFPLPAFVARAMLGEMANDLLLSSARVIPTVATDQGFRFQHPTLAEGLRAALSNQ